MLHLCYIAKSMREAEASGITLLPRLARWQAAVTSRPPTGPERSRYANAILTEWRRTQRPSAAIAHEAADATIAEPGCAGEYCLAGAGSGAELRVDSDEEKPDMRILQVADLFEPFIGGMEQHVESLSQGLAQRGHEVTVATAHLPGTALDEIISGFRVRRIAGWSARALARWYDRADAPFHPPIPDPGVIAALKRIIEEFRPDVVHAQGWITYSCLAIARNGSPPLVITLHDNSLACARKTFMRNGREACYGPRLDSCLRCTPGQYGVVKGTALTVGCARPGRCTAGPRPGWQSAGRYRNLAAASCRPARRSASFRRLQWSCRHRGIGRTGCPTTVTPCSWGR